MSLIFTTKLSALTRKEILLKNAKHFFMVSSRGFTMSDGGRMAKEKESQGNPCCRNTKTTTTRLQTLLIYLHIYAGLQKKRKKMRDSSLNCFVFDNSLT